MTAPAQYPELPEPADELAMEDGFNVIGSQSVFTADQMRAYVDAAREQDRACAAAPAGYKLVPVEPTAAMCKAAADAWLDCGSRLILNKAGAAARAAIAVAKEPA